MTYIFGKYVQWKSRRFMSQSEEELYYDIIFCEFHWYNLCDVTTMYTCFCKMKGCVTLVLKQVCTYTELASMGITANESEADLCSDKIFCEFHFVIFEIFYLILTEYKI